MLASDNNILCDVSVGSPMQNAFKHYWLPVMRTDKLVANGAPIKFTLLCEDYVAFRAEDGRVAVFAEKCPHRGCSLTLAANCDNALTCIFHGWKFDVSGKCVETPNVADPSFPSKVPLKYFQSREAGGMLWVYLAEGEPTRFPDYAFNQLPAEQVRARAARVDYNWLSGLDAILDPSHVGVLHANWVEVAPNGSKTVDISYQANDKVPTIELEPTDWGFSYTSLRNANNGQRYIRVNEYVEPSGCFITQSAETRKLFIMSVPIDNSHSIQWYIWYNPLGKLEGNDLLYALGNTDDDDNDFYHRLKGKPNWGQDREAMMRGESWTGFDDIMFEDFVVGESAGANPDRSHEFLCPADAAMIRARRAFLTKLKKQQKGEDVQFGHSKDKDFEFGALQSVGIVVGEDADWRIIAKERMAERTKALSK